MSEKEPDDTPLRRDHIEAFLGWWRARCAGPALPGESEVWWNALHTLTLGELRHGMRSYARFVTAPALSPPMFWQLCKGSVDERAVKEFQKMRDTIRTASPSKPRGSRTGDANG